MFCSNYKTTSSESYICNHSHKMMIAGNYIRRLRSNVPAVVIRYS